MNSSDSKEIALCIDCDGTLLRTDLLHEGVLALLKQTPFALVLLPWWLMRGKVCLKERIAERVSFDWGSLPYCAEILELIKLARNQGRHIVLATASPRIWADGIASHLGLFDRVIATEAGTNLSSENKARRLIEIFGIQRFDYAGNSASDLPVWKASRFGVVVSSSNSLVASAKTATSVAQVIATPRAGPLSYLRALRVHQWLKNFLIFVPLLAAHKAGAAAGLVQVLLAFMAFSLCASAVYVINDLLDLEADRQHIRKRKRPFASALIPIWQGVLMVPCLLAGAILFSASLPTIFSVVLSGYFAMTLAYSLRLKRQVIVDVLLLAALYTMRIIAGAAATEVVPSFWLLAFSMFVFLSLALVKRYSELLITLAQQKEAAAGRGYFVSDLPVLASIGASAGVAAVMVLALYINDPETAKLYPEKTWIWLVPPLVLYWISRVWLKTCRGEIDDDPVVFAIKDWQSLTIGVLLTICFALAASHISLTQIF